MRNNVNISNKEILTNEELSQKHYERMMGFLIADFEGKDFNECDIILRQIIKVAYDLLNEPDVDEVEMIYKTQNGM